MNDFFPTSDYSIPESSNYMKLTEGEHTFRVLSSTIVGWEYFSKDNKPVRSRTPFDEIPDDMKQGGRINHFWAFVVYNYEAKRIQILEIAQKTIQTPLQAIIKNPKWGSPFGYDITITRTGTGLLDTEYSVMPNPHSELESGIAVMYERMSINLDNLFLSLDPFGQKD